MSRIAENAFGDDLFYPRAPGHKEQTTSKDAARAVRGDAALLRERVFETVRSSGAAGRTADEAASLLERSVLSVRPRITELGKVGRIMRTGARRENESGLKATVWRAA